MSSSSEPLTARARAHRRRGVGSHAADLGSVSARPARALVVSPELVEAATPRGVRGRVRRRPSRRVIADGIAGGAAAHRVARRARAAVERRRRQRSWPAKPLRANDIEDQVVDVAFVHRARRCRSRARTARQPGPRRDRPCARNRARTRPRHRPPEPRRHRRDRPDATRARPRARARRRPVGRAR